MQEFDTTKFRLGNLCGKGHDWNGTGHSLRKIRQSGKKKGCVADCIECDRLRKAIWYDANKDLVNSENRNKYAANKSFYSARNKSYRDNMTEEKKQEFVKQRHEYYIRKQNERKDLYGELHTFTGKLCKNNHRHNGGEVSLYRVSTGSCIECEKASNKLRYYANPEKSKQYTKDWQKRNRDRHLKNKRTSYYRHKVKILARQKDYRQQDCVKERKRQWYKTELGRLCSRRASFKRKQKLKTQFGILNSKLMIARLEQFNHSCSYCGSTENITWDHVVPLAKEGLNCITNMIPACLYCNCSKQDRDVLEWYQSKDYFDLTRWEFISSILGSCPEDTTDISSTIDVQAS